MLKSILVYLVLYLLVIFFSFLSELIFRKVSFGRLRKNYKKVLLKSSLIFLIFVIASLFYQFMGIKFNE